MTMETQLSKTHASTAGAGTSTNGESSLLNAGGIQGFILFFWKFQPNANAPHEFICLELKLKFYYDF